MHHLGLDPAYTRVPRSVFLSQDNNREPHVVASHLAALFYPKRPSHSSTNIPTLARSWKGKEIHPSDWLTCVDHLYYLTSGADYFEWRFSWSPAWNVVGKHARFNRPLVERSEGYLRKAFGLQDSEAIPPVRPQSSPLMNCLELISFLLSLWPFISGMEISGNSAQRRTSNALSLSPNLHSRWRGFRKP